TGAATLTANGTNGTVSVGSGVTLASSSTMAINTLNLQVAGATTNPVVSAGLLKSAGQMTITSPSALLVNGAGLLESDTGISFNGTGASGSVNVSQVSVSTTTGGIPTISGASGIGATGAQGGHFAFSAITP